MKTSRPTTRWITVTTLVFILAIVLAFTAGQFVRSEHSQAIENAGITPPVTTVVEEKTLTMTTPTATGTVSVGRTWPLHVPTGEYENSVVTDVAVEPGTRISSGTVLGRVSGRPIIVLNLPFTLYRDLGEGDTGNDVRALQESLRALSLYSGTADGVYGAGTAQAVAALYRNNGLVPPEAPSVPVEGSSVVADTGQQADAGEQTKDGEQTEASPDDAADRADSATSQQATSRPGLTPVRMSEIATIPEASATIDSVASIGDQVGTDVPFAVLRGGSTTVTARIGAGSLDVFPAGASVSVAPQTDSRIQVVGTVVSVSEFRTSNPDVEGSIPGYDITIELPDDEALVDGSAVTVTGEVSASTTSGLAVPVTALREQENSTYLLLTDGTKVAVEVRLVADGFALVEGDVAAGDTVEIAVEP